MEHRNGSSPAPIVAQELFDQLNLLTERFALVADRAMSHLRGETAPGSPSYNPQAVADDIDHLCDTLDQFRDANGIPIPDLAGEAWPLHEDGSEPPR